MLNFISFADGSLHFRRSLKRIESEAANSNLFDSLKVYNLKTLRRHFPNFFIRHGSFLNEEPRAIGRWIWKPYLCFEFAKTSGDFLYLDAGSHLNLDSLLAKQRFIDYIKMLDESPVLSFQIRKNQFLGCGEETEKVFSRKELLEFCDPNKQIVESNQVEANVIFFRAGQISRAFFSEVLHVATYDNYFFMRDNRNCINQPPKPDLYRYDQSIYSLLYKKWNFKLIQNETWFHPGWKNAGASFPIWTVRNRTGVDIFKFRLRDLPEKFEVKYKIWMKIRIKLNTLITLSRVNIKSKAS